MNIDKYLTQGEVIDETFTLKGYDIHATNKRLFLSRLNGSEVQDFNYNHISSLRFYVERYYWLIGLGVAIITASWFFMNYSPFWKDTLLIYVGMAGGVGCIIIGILLRKERMTLFVIGYGKVGLEGKRKDLDGLFITVRGRKKASAVSTTQV